VIEKSGANLADLPRINVGLKFSWSYRLIEILRVRYLNNIVEHDHRFIKKITRPTLDFKAFHSAAATLAGIQVVHMIRKERLHTNPSSPLKQFASLAA
jgi:putative transposase